MDLDDGWEDVPRATPRQSLAPCTIVCTQIGRPDGKRRAARVSITFRLDKLPTDVATVLGGPRFTVSFNLALCAIRLRACDTGQYELTRAPAGRAATAPQTWLLRFPFPEKGMAWCDERTEIELDVNEAQRTIVIDLPTQFRVAPSPRAPQSHAVVSVKTPSLTPILAATQTPAQRESAGREAVSKFPTTLGGVELEVLEARLVGALYYSAEPLRRDALLRLTRDSDVPPGRDGRDVLWVDATVKALRSRLFKINVAVLSDVNGMYRLSETHKDCIRALLDSDR